MTTTNDIAVAGYSDSYAAQVDSGNSVEQIVKVEPGKTYELAGYIYLNGARARASVVGYSDADAQNQTQTSGTIEIKTTEDCAMTFTDANGNTSNRPITGAWYEFSYTVTAGETTNYLKVKFVGKSGLTWFDDISFYKVISSTTE